MITELFPQLWLGGHTTGQAVCLPPGIWARRGLGKYGLIPSAGTLMGLPLSLDRGSPVRGWHHTSGNVPLSLVCPSLQRLWGHLLFAGLFFVYLIFFILGGGRVAWGEKQIWSHKEKSEGGIRGISHLQIYLLIWKGSQHWWQAEKRVKK